MDQLRDVATKYYPISEIFTEIQGEGVYIGQLQTFVRLAGCTVGKRFPASMYGKGKLPIYTERCTLYDGRQFECDTDYRVHKRLTAEEIIQHIPDNVDHVCITGGEPLMHDLSTLFTFLWGVGRTIHIETSGTIEADLKPDIWVTCSPKLGIQESMLARANELKFLVDKNFDAEKPMEVYPSNKTVELPYLAMQLPCFLQPVNGEDEISAENLQLCREWQRRYSAFRVSIQLHKAMSSILKEVVR